MVYYQEIKDLKGNTVGINVYGDDKGRVISEIIRNQEALKKVSRDIYLFEYSGLLTIPLKEAGFTVHDRVYEFRDLEDFLYEDLLEYEVVRIDVYRYKGLLYVSNWHEFLVRTCKKFGLVILYDYIDEGELMDVVNKAVKVIQPYDKVYLKGFVISKPVKVGGEDEEEKS